MSHSACRLDPLGYQVYPTISLLTLLCFHLGRLLGQAAFTQAPQTHLSFEFPVPLQYQAADC